MRRAGILSLNTSSKDASKHEQLAAQEISRTLDGLPLALDQAGAYIRETRCGLSEYLSLYREQQSHLLGKSDALGMEMYPASVATTWSLSFEKVTQANGATRDFLHVCAFLAPEAIPEEILDEGAPYLGPLLESVSSNKLALNTLFKELLRFSLVYRDSDNQTFTIHRLVQAVIKDSMPGEMRRIWVERIVLAVNQAFPYVDFTEWLEYLKRWQRCLPHVLACVDLIKQWNINDPSIGDLIHNIGYFLLEAGREAEAEALLLQALTVRERILGVKHPDVGHTLNALAIIHRSQAKYTEAETLFLKTLGIWRQTLGAQTSQVATCLSNLAAMYIDQGRYVEAERFCKQSLAIREHVLGSDDPEVAYSLTSLGDIYKNQGKYKKAKKTYLRALSIREQILGSEHPTLAQTLHELAALYFYQEEYLDAETYVLRSLQILEKNFGKKHQNTALALTLLGLIYHEQRDFIQAESCHLRALLICRDLGLNENISFSTSANNLAKLYHDQGKYIEAEQLYLQSLSLWGQKSVQIYWFRALLHQNLAKLYHDQGKYIEAEQLYLQSLSLWDQNHVWHNRNYKKFTDCLNDLAALYILQNNYSKAESLYEQALKMREHVLGKGHPDVASSLESLASLFRKTQRETRACRLEDRARKIRAKAQRDK